MSLPVEERDASALRAALRMQEGACASDVPEFARVAVRIEARPSPLDRAHWPVAKGARLAASLAAAQLRVIPQAVLPAALVVAAAAAGGACFVASAGTAFDAAWWFAAFLLFGVALTVTLALSSERADALALATPLGPQTVVLARLAAVLGVDALAGVAASAVFAWWAPALEFGAVAGAWLMPLGLIAGASAFVAVWSEAPWVGAVAGAVLVPLVLPAAQALSAGGAAALLGGVRHALGPAGVLVVGAALLAATVCSARRAALARLQAE